MCRHRGGTRICVLTFRSARNRDTREAACIAHFYTVISKHTYLLSPHNFLSISMFIIHSSCISRPSHSSDRTCVYVNHRGAMHAGTACHCAGGGSPAIGIRRSEIYQILGATSENDAKPVWSVRLTGLVRANLNHRRTARRKGARGRGEGECSEGQ